MWSGYGFHLKNLDLRHRNLDQGHCHTKLKCIIKYKPGRVKKRKKIMAIQGFKRYDVNSKPFILFTQRHPVGKV